MAKIILTADGEVLKELPLIKKRITIGRRSHNDLVIDHVAISGEHAAIVTLVNDFFLEDLHSTNGTQINGQPVTKHFLQDSDVIELAPYKIRFVAGASNDSLGGCQHGAAATDREPSFLAGALVSGADGALQHIAVIRVLNGPSAGKALALAKPLTTIGRPGIQVAIVTRRKQGYFITHVEGDSFPLVNGDSIGVDPRLLNIDDVIDLSGTRMVFKSLGF